MKNFKALCYAAGCTVTLHQEGKLGRCPCYDEQMAVKSLDWHRENPDAEECGPDGYLNGEVTDRSFKAFVEPASKKSPQIIQRIFGELHAHDMFYIGPPDVDVRGLDRLRDYITYNGEKFEVINPELMKFMDKAHHYEAGLRRRD